ncbi:hypothetical protein WJX82_005744 [Trebouxia sp. C0006]
MQGRLPDSTAAYNLRSLYIYPPRGTDEPKSITGLSRLTGLTKLTFTAGHGTPEEAASRYTAHSKGVHVQVGEGYEIVFV